MGERVVVPVFIMIMSIFFSGWFNIDGLMKEASGNIYIYLFRSIVRSIFGPTSSQLKSTINNLFISTSCNK